MGHDDRERRRLALQASVINPLTEQLLTRAGISSSMEVLDLGCGIGDVSLLAARMVGRRGRITGLDLDPAALAIAKERAAAAGFANVEFVEGDLHSWRPGKAPDAVIGRHILIHTPDPGGVLRSVFDLLRPGGLAAFQEYDFSTMAAGYPPTEEDRPVREMLHQFFRRARVSEMGARLWHLFAEAGFGPSDCRGEFLIDGGRDSLFPELFAESMRSFLSKAVAMGIPGSADIDIDTLETRIRDEIAAKRASLTYPVMVGCFARKP